MFDNANSPSASAQRRGLVRAFSICVVWIAVTVAVPAAAGAQPAFRGPYDAYAAAPAMAGAGERTAPPGLRIAGRDELRHTPTLVIGRLPLPHGAGANAAQRGASHLRQLAPLYGLDAAALGTAEVTLVRSTYGGGALVQFRQRVAGVEVFESRASLVLDPQGALRAAGGQLRPVAPRPYLYRHDASAAVSAALADCWGESPPGTGLVRRVPVPTRSQADSYFAPTARAEAAGYLLDAPARARRVLFPLPTRLVPATYVELWVTEANLGPILVAYVVSAEDRRVLHRRLLTEGERFQYTVYADDTAPFLPIDGPFGDVTPDAAGSPVDALPSLTGRAVVTMEGFNTNPAGGVDPWLPAGATETLGNNADAYADSSAPDGFSAGDLRARTTSAGVFDHLFDATRQPDADDAQRSAVVTQLFYVNNWLHDYFYDVGFTEAAGNAQDDNFGRGGEAGDRLRLEAMDHGGTNNANMSTPADGSSPRMQMFLWSGRTDVGIEAGGASYSVGTAGWGPSVFDTTATTVLANDGVGATSDGCEPIVNDLTGQIALMDRGSCSFWVKAVNAQSAGAVGVIVMNDRAGGTTTMGGTPGSPVTIPALFVTQGDGAALRGAGLGLSTRMKRLVLSPQPDSSLDATVVVHEWGHYLHGRLVPGGSIQRRAQGEGWGDALAAVMLARPADDFAGAHPHAGYSNHGREFIYFGTRRVPYSTSRALNDLSFRHISVGEPLPTLHPLDPTSSNNAEVHNAGEVWATMLFEAFAALVERSREPGAPYNFEEMRARFASYLVLGMQLAPRNPTYTEQRDAILAAALGTDLEDARLIAAAFAARGAGTCAVAPDRDSTDLVGVVEDFAVASTGSIGDLAIDTTGPGRLCDADRILDGGEQGTVRVVVHNTGLVAFSDAFVEVTASDAGVRFPEGSRWSVGAVAPGEARELSVAVELDESTTIADTVTVTATLSGAAFCGDATAERTVAMDRDLAPSPVEAFDVPPEWFAETAIDGLTTGVWSVGPSRLDAGGGSVLRAADTASPTDTAVELPQVFASMTESLVLSFAHRFAFEADPGTLWDGGVVELSVDGGTTWADVDEYADPGYTGALSDRAGNPLSLRPAYSGTNPSSPAADIVTLDFGTALGGMAIRFRFRVGTDAATGGPGWEIDDLSITGVSASPFTVRVPDVAECVNAPMADAGMDFEVHGGDLFALDGTASVDPDGDPLTFAWQQITGEPALALDSPATASPELTAPNVDAATDFEFRLRVSDGAGSSTDDVRVRVLVAQPSPDAGVPTRDSGLAAGDGGLDGGAIDEDAGADASSGLRVLGGGGCSCSVASPTGDDGAGYLWLSAFFALTLGRRWRRKRPVRRG